MLPAGGRSGSQGTWNRILHGRRNARVKPPSACAEGFAIYFKPTQSAWRRRNAGMSR